MNQFNVSLWGDEGFSAILSTKSLPDIIKIITRDTSPPLYNITEHFAFRIFGTSEIVIRGLSFFYYCIAVFFIYKIAALLWNRRTGVYAAVLTFLNPFFFIYAFEGRMYSILAMGVCASMYFFLKKKWAFYVIATLVAIYSHHFAFFALFVQGIWFLHELIFGNRKQAGKMFLAFLAVAVLYIPWIIPLYNQTKMVTGGFWLGKPSPNDLKNLIYNYLATGISHPLSQTALYVVFVGILIRKWNKNIKNTLFMLSWFLVPILTTWLLSQKIQSIFYNRYLLYTIPAAMIILASNGRKYLHIVLMGVIIGIFVVVDVFYFTHPTKQPFAEMASYVKEFKRGDDYLINWNSSSHHLWEAKYYGIPAPLYIPKGDLPYFVGTALMEKDDIIRAIPNKKYYRIGVITSGPIEEVVIPNYTRSTAESFGDLKFIWFIK